MGYTRKTPVWRLQMWVLFQNALLFYCALYISPSDSTDAVALHVSASRKPCSNYLLLYVQDCRYNTRKKDERVYAKNVLSSGKTIAVGCSGCAEVWYLSVVRAL